jgi:PleD family two-component response regulator
MPGAVEDVGALLARADRAMYVAKGAGKNRLFVEAA